MIYFFVATIILIGSAIIFAAMRGDPSTRQAAKNAPIFGFIALVLVSIFVSFHQVPTGHIGVVRQFNSIIDQTGEGLVWVLPWQSLEAASIRTVKHEFPDLACFSRETQEFTAKAVMNVRVSPDHIQTLYRNFGNDWFEILVRPRVEQAIKEETVKYADVDVAPNRPTIRSNVTQRLEKELAPHSIEVSDFLLTNIDFPDDFDQQITQKQIEVQRALQEQAKVEGFRAKADQAIETARGEAESKFVVAQKQADANLALAKSITPELIQYLTVEKLAPGVQTIMVPAGNQFILGGDLLRKASEAKPQ